MSQNSFAKSPFGKLPAGIEIDFHKSSDVAVGAAHYYFSLVGIRSTGGNENQFISPWNQTD